MSFDDKLYEGKYRYSKDRRTYSEETFTYAQQIGQQRHILITSEVLSRVKTGEFLKIHVTYEVTRGFDPVYAIITRQLGPKQSVEIYDIELKTNTYRYSFKDFEGQVHSFERVYSGKPHIATPCFATSMFVVNQKKLDPVHRTRYNLLTSNNIWEFVEDPFEKDVFIEMVDVEQIKINVAGNDLKATHCKLLEMDENLNAKEKHDLYLSRHFSLPYKIDFVNGIEIDIEKLKHLQNNITLKLS